MSRKRGPLKPRSRSNENVPPPVVSSRLPNGGKAINGDFAFYGKLIVLASVAVGFLGFLFYLDILGVANTGSHLSDVKSRDSDEIPPGTSMQLENDDEEDEDESVYVEEVREDDLMEDEEEGVQLKPKSDPKLNTKSGFEEPTVDTMGGKSSYDRTRPEERTIENKKKNTNRNDDAKKEWNDAQKNSATTSEESSTINSLPKRKSKSKTGPIILTAENNKVILDPSQIKIQHSGEDTKVKGDGDPRNKGKDSGNRQEKSSEQKSTDQNSQPKSKSSRTKEFSDKQPPGQDSKTNQHKKSSSQTTSNKKTDRAQNNQQHLNKPTKDSSDDASKPKKSSESSQTTSSKKTDHAQNNQQQTNKSTKDSSDDSSIDEAEAAKNFKSTFHKTFTAKKIFADGRRIPPVELLHQKPSNSSVRVFLFDEFLSEKECDGLMKAHDSHVKAMNKPPLLCFDSISTLRNHLKDAKKNIKVTPNVFSAGTKCVNSSFSLQLQEWMKSNWSYSTAFYPGESGFSKTAGYRIQQAMGLDPSSGGKFQITSYPVGKAYKEHTDCVIGSEDKRDRVATVLMYLNDVEDGGETAFPELGIWVKPRKGRALVWNNMSPEGECEPHSKHAAKVVKKGSKYILIRWYYYQTFYSLGKRLRPPHLPLREEGVPMVNCNEYSTGSCRWYDEWSYEHILDYEKNKLTLF